MFESGQQQQQSEIKDPKFHSRSKTRLKTNESKGAEHHSFKGACNAWVPKICLNLVPIYQKCLLG